MLTTPTNIIDKRTLNLRKIIFKDNWSLGRIILETPKFLAKFFLRIFGPWDQLSLGTRTNYL